MNKDKILGKVKLENLEEDEREQSIKFRSGYYSCNAMMVSALIIGFIDVTHIKNSSYGAFVIIMIGLIVQVIYRFLVTKKKSLLLPLFIFGYFLVKSIYFFLFKG